MPTSQRVLIVEEETLVALEIEDVLAQNGFANTAYHRNVRSAAAQLDLLLGFDLAIIEARLGAAEVVEFTRQLTAAGVATVVMSADRWAAEYFPHSVLLPKPFNAEGLMAACTAAIGGNIS